METDPTRHLVKLISLVAYTDGKKCGMRQPDWVGGPAVAAALTQDEALMAHQMCMYYAGAARYVQRGASEDQEDYDELADFTLPFVTTASADVERLLGSILISVLGLLDKTEPRVLGRKWLTDVLNACWAAKLASAPERYGL